MLNFQHALRHTARRTSLIFLALLCAAPLIAAELPCPAGWAPHDSGVVSPRAAALGLDAVIQKALETVAATPGLAVGILADGEVIYSRGFGVRTLDTCAPVTPESVFYLLSVTKSFTGMLAALLQEEGTLELDQPLTHYLPETALPPPLNLGQTSIRDLLNHRAGFSNGAINFRTFMPGNLDNEGMLYVLEHHSEPLPITFRYTNMGYVVAGMVMEKVTGSSWRSLLEARLFAPLGMGATTTSIERATAGAFAYPYSVSLEDTFEPAMVKVEAQMHAAGGMASNVADLLRWVEANLEHGTIDGKPMLPPRVVRQAHAPQIQYSWQYGRYHRFAYGLGVHNSDLDGELVIHHFGGPIHVSFAPERGIGLVLLSAGPDSTGFVHSLGAGLYDLLLGKEGAQEALTAAMAAERTELDEELQGRRKEAAEMAARRGELARPAAAYGGTYVSDRLGTMTVTTDGKALTVGYGVLSLTMVPLEADTFLVSFPYGAGEVFRFSPWEGEHPTTLDWGGRLFERQP